LFATVTDPIGGKLLGLCGARNPVVITFTAISGFPDMDLIRA
jgi:hypothetical protein